VTGRSPSGSGSTSARSRIRVVAERDCYPLDEWERAIEFKRKACADWAALALKRPDLKEP
jgi:hypothetical protein